FLHALRSLPDKPAHAAAISSAQVLFVHFPAALASETKTPAASATAANATAALLVIVELPLYDPFPCPKIDFGEVRHLPRLLPLVKGFLRDASRSVPPASRRSRRSSARRRSEPRWRGCRRSRRWTRLCSSPVRRERRASSSRRRCPRRDRRTRRG